MERGGYVYVVSNKQRTVLYIGATSQLSTRIYDHKNGVGSAFTTKYKCADLVYYAGFKSIEEAIIKEKQMKKWKRDWKLNQIRDFNNEMIDLSDEVINMRL